MNPDCLRIHQLYLQIFDRFNSIGVKNRLNPCKLKPPNLWAVVSQEFQLLSEVSSFTFPCRSCAHACEHKSIKNEVLACGGRVSRCRGTVATCNYSLPWPEILSS